MSPEEELALVCVASAAERARAAQKRYYADRASQTSAPPSAKPPSNPASRSNPANPTGDQQMPSKLTLKERIERRRARVMGHYMNYHVWTPNVLRIAPEFAALIYMGKKTWEFRKAPLPIGKLIYLFETDPVNAITGRIYFDHSVSTAACNILDLAKKSSMRRMDPPVDRKTVAFLMEYVKPSEPVHASHVFAFTLFSAPLRAGVELGCGVWIDAPKNASESVRFSYREFGVAKALNEAWKADGVHYFYDDPADAAERFRRIRGAAGKEAARA